MKQYQVFKFGKVWLLVLSSVLLYLFSTARALAQTQASDLLGTELTYVNIAPGQYLVTYKEYRDCSGVAPDSTRMLTSFGMNKLGGPPIYINQILKLNGTAQGQPYCSGVTTTCSSTGNYPTIEQLTYSDVVYLSAPGNNVDWSFSISGYFTRAPSGNLVNPTTDNLWTEAILNASVSTNNSSPVFDKMPEQFICVDQLNSFSYSATDPDGDSLVYSIQPALSYSDTVTYAGAYAAGTSPGGTAYAGGAFSATNPVISQPPVALNGKTGTLQVKPLALASAVNNNRYVVVVQVDEYRKVNGVPVKIGHIRRDMIVTVRDCGTNLLPKLGSFTINGFPVLPDSVYDISVGVPVTIEVTTADDNPADVVALTSTAANALPGATVTLNGGARPTGTITWTPTIANLRSVPYFFTVTVTDNACPVKGTQTYGSGLRVRTVAGPLGLNQLNLSIKAEVSPNPNQGKFKLQLNNIIAPVAELTVTDLLGRVVLQKKLSVTNRHISEELEIKAAKGMYLLQVKAGKESISRKIVLE